MTKKLQSNITEYVPDTYLAELLNCSRASIWRWSKDPTVNFPAPVRIGKKSARWRLADVEVWQQRTD